MVVGAIHDGDIASFISLLAQCVYLSDDKIGLFIATTRIDKFWFNTRSAHSSQNFLELFGVAFDAFVGDVKNFGCASVVGFEFIDLRVFVAVGKGDDVFEIGSAPGIDALEVVTDNE